MPRQNSFDGPSGTIICDELAARLLDVSRSRFKAAGKKTSTPPPVQRQYPALVEMLHFMLSSSTGGRRM